MGMRFTLLVLGGPPPETGPRATRSAGEETRPELWAAPTVERPADDPGSSASVRDADRVAGP
jgi:hypothetical protein